MRKTNFVNQYGSTYYRVTKVIGHKDNKPVQKSFYGKSKSDAEIKANLYMQKLNSGLVITNQTVGSLMEYWLFNIKKYDNIKPSSFESYESSYRLYIKTHEMAFLRLENIKPYYLQDMYINMAKNGISSSNINKVNKVLRMFFKWCILEGYLIKNPCDNIKVPKETKTATVLEYFTENEVRLIKEKLKDNELETIVLFAIGTGLREGELLALRYSDIDYTNSQLYVNRTVKNVATFEGNKKEYKTLYYEPKTKNSKRVVDIPKNLLAMLPVNHSQDIIFNFNAHTLNKKWKKFLSDNQLPVKKFHSLRHTYATLLLSKGVELITVSKLLRSQFC